MSDKPRNEPRPTLLSSSVSSALDAAKKDSYKLTRGTERALARHLREINQSYARLKHALAQQGASPATRGETPMPDEAKSA